MADKKSVIIDLKFDVSDFTKEAAKLNGEISQLNKQQKELKKDNKEGSIEFQKNAQTLKENRRQLAENNKVVQNLTIANKENAGSNQQMKAQLSLLTLEYNKLSKEERESGKRGKELKGQINQLTSELKTNEEGIGNNRRSVGDYGRALEGTKFGGFITGIKATGAAFKANPIGLIITAIVAALALLSKAFLSSEEGQNKFAKAQAVLSSVMNNFLDVVANIADGLVAMFENPKKALEDFGTLLKNNIVNRFEGLVELVPQLGKAIGLLFKGEFAEAGAVATNAVAKVSLGVNDLTGKLSEAGKAISEFSKATIDDANAAAEIADKRAKADIIERDLLIQRAKAESVIAEARRRSNDIENESAESRKQALQEAATAIDNLAKAEEEAARLRLEALRLENTLSNSNKEAKQAEAQAEADLINIQTKRSSSLKSLLLDQKRVNNEIKKESEQANKEQEAADKKAAIEAVKNADIELQAFLRLNQSKLEANKFLNDEFVKQEVERLQAIEAQQIAFEKLRFENGIINQKAFNEAKAQIEAESVASQEAIKEEKEISDKEKAIEDLALQREIDLLNNEDEFLLRQQDLDRAKEQELEAAKTSGADIQKINEKFNLLDKKLEQEKTTFKLQLANQVFGEVGALATQGSNLQKVLAATQATINGALAITSILAAPPSTDIISDGIIRGIRIGAAVGTTAQSLNRINSTPKAAKGGVFGGELHSNGGTKGYFSDGTQIEVERGELFAVINRNSTAMLSQMSAINEAGGGNSFFSKGGIQSFQDGGIALNNASTSVENNNSTVSELIEAVANLPSPVVAVQDINTVQSDTNRIEARAEL